MWWRGCLPRTYGALYAPAHAGGRSSVFTTEKKRVQNNDKNTPILSAPSLLAPWRFSSENSRVLHEELLVASISHTLWEKGWQGEHLYPL